MFLFADDTKLFSDIRTENNVETLQHDLNNLFDWSIEWMLRFHPDKCKVLKVHNKWKEKVNYIYIMKKYDGTTTTLESVESEKDIGVNIDSHLCFDKHIQTQINKANQIVGIIRRTFCSLDYKSFCLLFKALVRPQLEYANSVWNPYKCKDTESIENVQRRATKMLPYLSEKSYQERLEY